MSFIKSTGLAALIAAAVSSAWAAQPRPGVRLSVYNDFALIKDRRVLKEPFRPGINVVRFRDVASTIDAASVHFRSLTDPTATVIEQISTMVPR